MQPFEWTRPAYESSVSSRCWWYTPYDDGWDGSAKHGAPLSADDELRQVVAMEHQLDSVPQWAHQVVERSINWLPPCGHYLFPQPYLEAVSAIGSQAPPEFVHGCFAVQRVRKRQMMDYVLCLDAWLAGAEPQAAARELKAFGHRRIDWHSACAGLWNVLGEHSQLKDLLIERLIHSQRWKIKDRPWHDDLAADFGRDQYLGTLSETGNIATENCYIAGSVPGFRERSSPRVRKLEAKLAAICPDWNWFRYHIRYGWLCAPKAFRFLERLLWAIGLEKPLQKGAEVPPFLQCEDTYPNEDEAAQWYTSFRSALTAWWQQRPETGSVANDVNDRLGQSTPAKRWLVRLLLRKLNSLAANDEGLRRLVKPSHGHKRGARPLLPGPAGPHKRLTQ